MQGATIAHGGRCLSALSWAAEATNLKTAKLDVFGLSATRSLTPKFE